jgi:hypothetical protein
MLAGSGSRRRPANHATVTVSRVRAPAAANTGRGPPRAAVKPALG